MISSTIVALAAAPSEIWEELPAWITPPSPETGVRFARVSAVVPRRSPSSILTTLRSVVTGTSCRSKAPLSIAKAATPAAVAAKEIADKRGIASQQVALAWALAHSHAMLPIPGTSKLPHLDENIDAAFIELTKDEIARLESAVASA